MNSRDHVNNAHRACRLVDGLFAALHRGQSALLWGFRDQINLRDPLFWIFQVGWLVVLYRSGKSANSSRRLAR